MEFTKFSLFNSNLFIILMLCLTNLVLNKNLVLRNQAVNTKNISNIKIDKHFYKYLHYKLLPGRTRCNISVCPTSKGTCVGNSLCKCKKGLVDLTNLSNISSTVCHYKQRKHLLALVLEFFSLCGLGHFYSLRIIVGCFKLIFACLALLSVYSIKYESKKRSFGYMFSIGFISVFMIVHLFDLWNFAFNEYLDGNGVELVSWSI